jgi:predicted dehydrogenase
MASSPKRFLVAFIGAGGRSVPYAQEYARNDRVRVVALADPSPEHRRQVIRSSGLPRGVREYDDWRALLRDHPRLDGAVICTPNHLHADPAVACLERGMAVACEKPLATTPEDCERILDAEREHHGRTLIGFVLRSTPFYRRIRDLIRSGGIGAPVAIQADELVGWMVTSLMMRSPWRRFTALSGGALLEKCCHDMDLLNWIADARPLTVYSTGDRLVFRPNPALPDRCENCPHGQTCRYYKRPTRAKAEDEGEERLHYFMGREGVCVYHAGGDLADTQSVVITYENGVIANFMMAFNCAGERASRNMMVVGQRGNVWGNFNQLKVHWHRNDTDTEETFPITTDGSGHGGGDREHAGQLVRMMADPDYRPEQNAQAAYLSAMVCFAAERARALGRQVRLQYGALGRIKLE